MIRIEDIIEKVKKNRPEPDIDLIRRAYFFSVKYHGDQKRASGEPYLVHPLAVADILADMRLDETSVSTGLLHDVVEDTLVDLNFLREYFGDEITRLVDGLTKIAHISNLSKEKQQAENVRKMLLAMVSDVRTTDSAWIKGLVRDIVDYPHPGVTFRDITPLLGSAEGFQRARSLPYRPWR